MPDEDEQLLRVLALSLQKHREERAENGAAAKLKEDDIMVAGPWPLSISAHLLPADGAETHAGFARLRVWASPSLIGGTTPSQGPSQSAALGALPAPRGWEGA